MVQATVALVTVRRTTTAAPVGWQGVAAAIVAPEAPIPVADGVDRPNRCGATATRAKPARASGARFLHAPHPSVPAGEGARH